MPFSDHRVGILSLVVLLAQATAEKQPIVLTPLQMLLLAAGLSMLGGLAASLRKEPASVKSSITVMLNTAILGAGISMIGYSFVATSPVKIWMVIGTATLASLGGLSVLDAVVQSVKARITLNGKNNKHV